MNARFALLAVALAATAPAFAGSTIGDLADYTGLSERQVRMVLGERSAFPEYRITYDRSLAQFKRVLGKERAEQLIAGKTVVLDRRTGVRVAKVDEARNERPMP